MRSRFFFLYFSPIIRDYIVIHNSSQRTVRNVPATYIYVYTIDERKLEYVLLFVCWPLINTLHRCTKYLHFCTGTAPQTLLMTFAVCTYVQFAFFRHQLIKLQFTCWRVTQNSSTKFLVHFWWSVHLWRESISNGFWIQRPLYDHIVILTYTQSRPHTVFASDLCVKLLD